MNPLQKLVADRLAELDLSYRRAAARSGGLVSHATLNQLVLGRETVTGKSHKTLQGIALAIDLPLSVVAEAAGQTPKEPTEFRLPKKANKLSPKQRRAILAMVNALLDEQESDEDHDE